MGGQRVLILVDVSTSMLGRSLLEIIDRRIRSDEVKLQAPKWRQVVDSVDWLTAQIPPGTDFQIIAFNSEAWPVIEGSDGQWLTATDGSNLDEAVEALRAFVPGSCRPGVEEDEDRPCGGTSLHAALGAIQSLNPRPDNVYLLVDGLPTMGAVFPSKAGVTGRERYQHFERALREASRNIPINVLLYALEGDPMSAPLYWALALETGGSLMAPSEDWP
jgi:hypothetical protein